MYQYTLKFRPTAQHANADALSRLPLPEMPENVPVPGEFVLLIDQLADAPISATQLKSLTAKDPLLAKVLQFIRYGWPNSVNDADLKPYFVKTWELTELDGCIIWCSRVLIPPQARDHILAELHGGHPGGARMKSLARRFVWLPGMDQQIEETVRNCLDCQQSQPAPPVAPLCSWRWPTRPWSRIHIDFAGPMDNRTFLVIIDAHSKWLEVIPMNSTSATATIQALRTTFSQFGLPESIVSDNGPQFTSSEFSQFVTSMAFATSEFRLITHPRMVSRNVQCRHLRKALRNFQRAQFQIDFLDFYFPTVLPHKRQLRYHQLSY